MNLEQILSATIAHNGGELFIPEHISQEDCERYGFVRHISESGVCKIFTRSSWLKSNEHLHELREAQLKEMMRLAGEEGRKNSALFNAMVKKLGRPATEAVLKSLKGKDKDAIQIILDTLNIEHQV